MPRVLTRSRTTNQIFSPLRADLHKAIPFHARVQMTSKISINMNPGLLLNIKYGMRKYYNKRPLFTRKLLFGVVQ